MGDEPKSFEETAPAATDTPTALEILAMGPDGVLSFSVAQAGEVTIGRTPNNTIAIGHPSVSREHAILRLTPSLAIADRGSQNGVNVRGARIPQGELIPIALGEPFELGDVTFVVHRRARRRWAARSEPPTRAVVADAAMRTLYDLASRAGATDLSVLIHGETGSGKDLLAEAVHAASSRRDGPFVRVNCAAIPSTLMESELFGHVRGAFTGAIKDKVGFIEAADGGTLFLDEVGDLPGNIQAALLRVLEDRRVTKVGSTDGRSVDVRFVAATHRDLPRAIAAGSFREDLFFRLNGIAIEVPPLRARRAEIMPLVERFVNALCARLGRPAPTLMPETVQLLHAYRWPGNVRELRNVVERALVLAGDRPIAPEHLPKEVRGPSAPPVAPDATPVAAPLDGERERIIQALQQCGGNQSRAAALLGISRRTLLKRLDHFGLPRPIKDR